MDKIRVLWFSNTPAAGDELISSNGSGGWMKSLDKAIQDKIELHVVFSRRGYPSAFIVGATRYYCVALNSWKERFKSRLQRLLGKDPDVKRFLGIVEKVKPEVIHIHGTEMSWIRIVPYIHGIPVILSIQAIVTVMTHKLYSGILRTELPLFSVYRRQLGYYSKRAEDERLNTQYVQYLIGRTEWDKRCYSVIAPHAQYFVCNEVLRDGFYKSIWQEPYRADNKLIVHSTTGEHIFKGLETICQAVTLINNVGVDVEWRIAGVRKESEFVKIVKRKLKTDFPNKGLLILGSLKEEDLINRMKEAHVYVSASHQDNSPNALCEAMLLGMPCVSTFAGGSGSILKDGITGILVQDGDPWAMAGAVLELFRERQKALQYASAARKDAILRQDKDAITNNLLRIYQHVLMNKQDIAR